MTIHFKYYIVRVLFLIAIFILGYLEAAFFKSRDWACMTWFWGLACLTVWIIYPLTVIRICIGVIIFFIGMILIIIYNKKAKRSKEEVTV